MKNFKRQDYFFAFGIASLLAGIAMLSVPACLIFAGLFSLGFGFLNLLQLAKDEARKTARELLDRATRRRV